MKYREFKKKVRNMGFDVEERKNLMIVRTCGDLGVISVSKKEILSFDPAWTSFYDCSYHVKKELFDLACELAKTPLKEREEEKRYKLCAYLPFIDNPKNNYLNYCVKEKDYFLGDNAHDDSCKTIFTETELKDIDETGFIREEVLE